MPRRAPFSLLPVVLPAVLLAAAACTDRNPAASPDASPAPLSGGPAAAVLQCTVEVRTALLSCRPSGPQTARGVSPVILGGQGTNVRLSTSGTAYDPDAQVLHALVTVQNLTTQALGVAADSAAPEGVRVFFHSGPTVTGGTGAVTVANADGEGAFTGAGQKYYQYDGILAPGATTAAKEWRFSAPSTVSTFVFTVYVAAPVRGEAGWIGMTPIAPTLLVGDTQRITATVRGVTGRVLADQPMAWWSSNTNVATVDAQGLVTAKSAGTVYITATSGGRSGRVQLQVSAGFAPLLPTVVSFEMDTSVINASNADSLTVRVAVKAGGEGPTGIWVWLKRPNGIGVYICDNFTLVAGTVNDGVHECKVPFGPYSRRGVWQVESVRAFTWNGESREADTNMLRAAGAPTWLRVENGSDVTAPVLHSFDFSPKTLTSGEQAVVDVDAGVSDLTGVERVTVTFRNPASTFPLWCTSPTPRDGSTTDGTFRCGLVAYAPIRGGDWYADEVRVEDLVGNVTVLRTADLQAAGFPTHLVLNSPTADIIPPTITTLTFGAGVFGNTSSSLFVKLIADGGQSSILEQEVVFQKVGGNQTRRCTSRDLSFVTGTIQCAFQFDATEVGTWRVHHVYLLDGGNARTFSTSELQAAGFFTQFTVVAP